MDYYTPITILIWIALLVMCILVHENNRFTQEKKYILYFTYILLGCAALFEWLGVQLNGNMKFSPWLLRVVKLFDYILTPIAGGVVVLQFQTKGVFKKLIYIFLGFNIIYQFVSFFTGWMITVDSEHVYNHGPGYNVYVVTYLIITLLVIVEFFIYGKKFKKQNRISLIAILLFVLTGIVMQEVLGRSVRTAYISLVLCLALLYIHNQEFSELASDDKMHEQLIKISVDPLTGISSRYAYNQEVMNYKALKTLPNDLVAISIDINGLKRVNDNFGHLAGDELICGASQCISNTFIKYGKCYRTGGDEFIVFIHSNSEDEIKGLTALLKDNAKAWKGSLAPNLSLSIGYARVCNFDNVTIENLISLADQKMYADKNKYYEENNLLKR